MFLRDSNIGYGHVSVVLIEGPCYQRSVMFEIKIFDCIEILDLYEIDTFDAKCRWRHPLYIRVFCLCFKPEPFGAALQ